MTLKLKIKKKKKKYSHQNKFKKKKKMSSKLHFNKQFVACFETFSVLFFFFFNTSYLQSFIFILSIK